MVASSQMGMCRDRERDDVIVEGLGFSVFQLGFSKHPSRGCQRAVPLHGVQKLHMGCSLQENRTL